MTKIALALGGNLEDTAAVFASVLEKLAAHGLQGIRHSTWYRTSPVGCHPGTPDFLNGALTAEWAAGPQELLELTQSLEQQAGRPKIHDSRASRILDLDLLLFGEQIVRLPDLVIPHPRMTERLFVILPLAEIAPDWVVPGYGKSVGEIREDLLGRK